MECIYCGSKTHVANSRPQKRLMQVWRRRACPSCKAVFTTTEAVSLEGSLVVRTSNGLQPFSRDKLYLAVARACGHRTDAAEASSALTATIIAKLRKAALGAEISHTDIIRQATETLRRFDSSAAVQYTAYHPIVKS
jgi:transcriptional repressor NrdR